MRPYCFAASGVLLDSRNSSTSEGSGAFLVSELRASRTLSSGIASVVYPSSSAEARLGVVGGGAAADGRPRFFRAPALDSAVAAGEDIEAVGGARALAPVSLPALGESGRKCEC